MKLSLIASILLFTVYAAFSQELQLHYDFRHSVDPELNDKNFAWLDFKYFKKLDTLDRGDFLLEVQSYFNGNQKNVGQTFIQLAQNIKFWKPKLYLYLYFSGGLGVTPSSFGYYISNAYSAGVTYPLTYSKTWFSFSLMYRYSALTKPSHDPQLNIYVGGGLFNYRLMYSNTLVFWAPDIENGLPGNTGKQGKKIAFFADPQLWYGVGKGYAVGTRVSVYYHVLNDENRVMFYPTLSVKKGL